MTIISCASILIISLTFIVFIHNCLYESVLVDQLSKLAIVNDPWVLTFSVSTVFKFKFTTFQYTSTSSIKGTSPINFYLPISTEFLYLTKLAMPRHKGQRNRQCLWYWCKLNHTNMWKTMTFSWSSYLYTYMPTYKYRDEGEVIV